MFQTALPPGISQGFEGQGAPTLPSSKDNRHLSHNSSHSRNFGGLRLERSQCLGGDQTPVVRGVLARMDSGLYPERACCLL